MLGVAPAQFLAHLGVGVLPEPGQVPRLLDGAEVRCEDIVADFQFVVCNPVLAAQLHKVLNAGGYLDQHAFCTFYRLPA